MDAFGRELMRRSRLAGAVLEISDFIFDDQLLDSIYSNYRGRCYEDVLGFTDFLRLMRDALVRHGGSAHKLFVELESRDAEPVDESNFYRKLARTPVAVSRALLRECTGRLGQLMPASAASHAACFDGLELIIGDGKKIKNAAKRLKLTRGYSGKLLGAKALVAIDARSGMAIAMSDSLDGLTNDVPLVPELMEQLRQLIPRPILSIWDRQFDDVRTLRRLSSRAGDAFLVRMKQSHTTWVLESAVERIDAQGRRVLDEIGLLGKGTQAIRVRRVTLFREKGEENVELLTNLTDRAMFAAADLLELYKKRWGIEQVFQQVTETFARDDAARRIRSVQFAQGGAAAVLVLSVAVQSDAGDQGVCGRGRGRAGERGVDDLFVQRCATGTTGLGVSHGWRLAAHLPRRFGDATPAA